MRILLFLCGTVLFSIGGHIYLIWVGSQNDFLKTFTLGSSTSILGALVAFIAIDLLLEKRKQPIKSVAYDELGHLVFNINNMITRMGHHSHPNPEEYKAPEEYQELYTPSRAKRISENLDLRDDAPVTEELGLTWYEYLITKVDYLNEEIDKFTMKFGSYVDEEVVSKLENDVRRNFLSQMKSFAKLKKVSDSTTHRLPKRFLKKEFGSMRKFLKVLEPTLKEENKEISPPFYAIDDGPF